MTKKTLLIAVFLFISILGLSGCLPTCDPGSLMAPDLVYPDWREIVNGSTVDLEWSYPDSSCEPEEYEIILSQERDYSVIEITDTVDGSENTYSPSGLDIAEEYFWRVRARVGTTYGSYSHELRSFFTEPVCDPGDLEAPIQTLPVNGGIFDIGYSSLEWEWPVTTCIPTNYKIEVSTASDLSITTDFGATSKPGTRWGFGGSSPMPATQYYWRVAPYTDGVLGPFSEIWTFYTDPICAPGALVAPDPIFPTEGTEFVFDAPSYEWSYPDPSCTPMGYHLQVSGALDFSATAPIVLDLRQFNTDTLWVPTSTLGNCEDYYWRVAAIESGVDGPWSTPISFTMNAMDACSLPPCGPGDIPTPNLVWPGSYEIILDLTPSLQWENPGICDPEGYAIELSHKHDFSDIVVSGGTGTPDTSWGPSAPFEVARQYRWHVAGMVGTTLGDWSGPRSFFTGPECTSVTEVVAPVLLEPENGSVQSTLLVVFHFQAASPTCLPDGVFLNLQIDPTFSGPNLMGEFSIPANTVFADPPLTDCTLYFWKGAYIQDGVYGPESDVSWFYTNESGSCPAMPVPSTAKRNTFCREGTYPEYWPDALHLFLEGDYVPVIAKNPFSTYLMTYALNEDGFTPLKPIKYCWMLDTVRFWADKYPKELPIRTPPPTPVPSPTPTPKVVCNIQMGPESCKAAGGVYTDNNTCDCP